MNPGGRPRVAGLVLAAAASLLVPGCRGRGAAPVPETPGEAGAPAAPAEQIVLFYPGDDTLLHRERREVPELPAAVPPRIKLVVGELLAGSREGRPAAFPWMATVEAVFVDRAGNAFVDLSAPPEGAIEGTADEAAVVYAVVESVVANCPGVERVQLLFDGSEVATLGHLDLSRPLAPRPELVAP